MPSLRKRMSTYFRQLSFHNDPRDRRNNINENSFITKYLQGQIQLEEGAAIIHGKNPTDLPIYKLASYEIGSKTIQGCYSGPNGGLTTVKRLEKHLSVLDADIDFIDTPSQATAAPPPDNATSTNQKHLRKSPNRHHHHQAGQPVDNTSMVIKVAGQEYCVTNATRQKSHNKSHSLGNVTDFGQVSLPTVEIEKTKIDRRSYQLPAKVTDPVKSDSTTTTTTSATFTTKSHFALAKSRSEGNPFKHSTVRKQGKIIKVIERPVADSQTKENACSSATLPDDSLLPTEWNKKDDRVYGLSDSLYDRNQVTGKKNGDPIADCFGVISRGDSAILAVADGVNWGEKASIAAKSAVHGCLHYLNKTLFGDTKPFEQLTVKTDESSDVVTMGTTQRVANTRDVFIALLRAFNCAHDLILENSGMLTTLTVAVILPVKSDSNNDSNYVCCVCNVGDTLAYVYSHQSGLREVTKGSHDVTSNRDMRDALGALGPVDGINPELSNLTLSVTAVRRGDIIMVASDGLTDNFDPNVSKFTVNSTTSTTVKSGSSSSSCQNRPPVKPPRKKHVTMTTTNDAVLTDTKRHNQSTSSGESGKQLSNYKLMRAKTSVDMKRHNRSMTSSSSPLRHVILRNDDGIPYVTPLQRYELQLLLMEDILKNGISGKDTPTSSAKTICQNLVNYAFSVTAAKRRTLEDPDLYFDSRGGVMVEVSNQEKKARRKKGLERVQTLPGKLDHVTVVAYVVGRGDNDSANVKSDVSSVTPVTEL